MLQRTSNLNPPVLSEPPGMVVLRGRYVAAAPDPGVILRHAQQAAQKLLSQTDADIQCRRTALARRIRQARVQSRRRAETAAQRRAALALAQKLAQLECSYQEKLRANEQECVRIAIEAVQALFQSEPPDSTALARYIAECLSRLNSRDPLQLQVAPTVAALLPSVFNSNTLALPVVPDPTMAPSVLRLVGSAGAIELDWNRDLEQMQAWLAAALQQAP